MTINILQNVMMKVGECQVEIKKERPCFQEHSFLHFSIYITIWNTSTISGIVIIDNNVVITLIALAYFESFPYT